MTPDARARALDLVAVNLAWLTDEYRTYDQALSILADTRTTATIATDHWQEQGLCRGRRDLDWFPGRGESLTAQRKVCAECPVRIDCLAWALDHPAQSRYGIWGGTSEKQRRQMRRDRRASGDDELVTAPHRPSPLKDIAQPPRSVCRRCLGEGLYEGDLCRRCGGTGTTTPTPAPCSQENQT